MYYLMNKDTVAAFIDKNNGQWKLWQQRSELPVGNFEINKWLEDRKAYKHNHHLKQLMEDCGCSTTEGFINITHAASINDSFWIKRDDEKAAWNDVSFYRNDFNDTISRLAFEGLGLYGIQMSSTSPELTTDGSFRKCWKKEDGEIYLYKRGFSGAFNSGLEPYCEALASEIINQVDAKSVKYSVIRFHGEAATKCKAFTSENVGFVPLRKLLDRGINMEGLLKFFDNLGCREEFQRMIVLDAVTFNTDRHLGNMGVLIDNDTQKMIEIAPNFDFNLSMLPYVIKDEFEDIGAKLLDYGPAVEGDFTRNGQKMLTSKIRNELTGLRGFAFSFRGNKDFEPWRVEIMEKLVNRQIEAILSGEILYTRDVFIPEAKAYESVIYDNSEDLRAADVLVARLKSARIFSSVMAEIREDNHVQVIATIHQNDNFFDIVLRMGEAGISYYMNGIEKTADEMREEMDAFDDVLLLAEEIRELAKNEQNNSSG